MLNCIKEQQLSSASISLSAVQLISLTERFLMNLASLWLPEAKTHTQSHSHFARGNALTGLSGVFPADYRATRWSFSVKLKSLLDYSLLYITPFYCSPRLHFVRQYYALSEYNYPFRYHRDRLMLFRARKLDTEMVLFCPAVTCQGNIMWQVGFTVILCVQSSNWQVFNLSVFNSVQKANVLVTTDV